MLAGGAGGRLLSLSPRAQKGRMLFDGAVPPELGAEAVPPERERGLKQPRTPSPVAIRSMVQTNRTVVALDGPNPGFPTIGTTEPRASHGDSRNGVDWWSRKRLSCFPRFFPHP